jgi:hypothetical protein
LGYVSLSRIPSASESDGDLRGFLRARHQARAALKTTPCGTCGRAQRGWYDRRRRRVRDLACGDLRIYLDLEVRRVACQHCGKVKQEQHAFVADNPLYTKRFALYVGAPLSGVDDPGCGPGPAA